MINVLSFNSFARKTLSLSEINYLKENEPIVFVSQNHYAPFEFVHDEGKSDGMSIELVRWIATEFGFKARFIDTTFSNAQQMVLKHKADVLTSFFYSKKRDKVFDFTHPMFFIPATIFVDSDRPDIKGLNDLMGKTIAIQNGDYAEEFLKRKNVNVKLIYTNNFGEATNLVVTGMADAIIGDEQIVLYYLYTNDLEKTLKMVGSPLYIGENSMAVVQGNDTLRSILDKGIQLAEERGVLKNISDKWLGIRLYEKDGFLYEYRWYIIIFIFLILGLLSSVWFWNVSLRKEVKKRTIILRENEQFLNNIIKHIPNVVFVKSATDSKYIFFNSSGENSTGYNDKDILGRSDFDIFPEEQANRIFLSDQELLSSKGLIDIPEEIIQTKHHGQKIFHTKKLPIFDEEGMPKFILGIAEDITEKKRSELALKESDERLRAAIAAIDEGFVIYDQEDRLVYCNQKFREIYPQISEIILPGVSFKELLTAYSQYLLEDPSTPEKWIDYMLDQHAEQKTSEQRTADGRWIKSSNHKTADGSTVGVRIDITKVKESEENLKTALHEKETLLKEVHHRVKNNMQVISSMLSLQMQTIKNQELLDAFLQAENRISAMALVHENLYQTESLANISAISYLKNLCSQLSCIMFANNAKVDFEFDIDNISIPIEDAVPFGLIATEIITNSLKYAFVCRPSGTIKISLINEKNNLKKLKISDDGIGLPTDINPNTITTLGMRLIRDLTEGQLEGSWFVDGNDGVSWLSIGIEK